MKTCEISTLQEDGTQHVTVTVELLDDGTLHFSGDPTSVANAKEVPVPLTGGQLTATSDPVRWFYCLPFTYNGAYRRAQIIGATEEETAQMLESLKRDFVS